MTPQQYRELCHAHQCALRCLEAAANAPTLSVAGCAMADALVSAAVMLNGAALEGNGIPVNPSDAMRSMACMFAALPGPRPGDLQATIGRLSTGHGASVLLDEEQREQLLDVVRGVRVWVDECERLLHGRRPRGLRARGIIRSAVFLLAIALAWNVYHWVRAAVAKEGVVATYYLGSRFRWPVARRVEQRIEKNYGAWFPAWPVLSTRYSVRWEGLLMAPTAAEYAFFSECEGLIRVWIDDEILVDRWMNMAWSKSGTHATRILAAGPHKIRVEYARKSNRGILRIKWAGGTVADNTVIGYPFLKPDQ